MTQARLKRSLVAAVLFAALLVYHFVFFPWWRLPARSAREVEERFERLARLAVPEAGIGESQILREALDRFRASSALHRAELIDANGDSRHGFPNLASERLDADGQAALAALRLWHTTGGGFATGACHSLCSSDAAGPFQCAIALKRLGTLALATATPDERTTVDAVLHLARAMRGSGGQAEFIIGASLAEQSVAWARSRDVPTWSSFQALRPREPEVVSAFARERWCTFAPIERRRPAAGWFDFAIRPTTSAPAGLEPPLGIVRPARERLVALDTAATAVLAAAAHASDLSAMSRAVTQAMLEVQDVRRTSLELETDFAPTIVRAQRTILDYAQLPSG